MKPKDDPVLADLDRVIVRSLGTPIDSAEFADALAELIAKHSASNLLRSLILSRAALLARHLNEQITP